MVTRRPSELLNVEFWATNPTPCPYLEGRQERKILTKLKDDRAVPLYDLLALNGFRRSHGWAYRPDCEGCRACVPVRVVVAGFQPSRSQRRAWRRNGHLHATWRPPQATAEQYAVFSRYVSSRHDGGDMADMSWDDYRAMIEDAPVRSGVVEWRDPAGRLRAAMLVDRLGDGISAVYSFFEPEDASSSPGTFLVLDTIVQCKAQGLPYLYLGYWVAESRKMAYKSRFQPMEGLGMTGWYPLDEVAASVVSASEGGIDVEP